jgi:hypothetical protein
VTPIYTHLGNLAKEGCPPEKDTMSRSAYPEDRSNVVPPIATTPASGYHRDERHQNRRSRRLTSRRWTLAAQCRGSFARASVRLMRPMAVAVVLTDLIGSSQKMQQRPMRFMDVFLKVGHLLEEQRTLPRPSR